MFKVLQRKKKKLLGKGNMQLANHHSKQGVKAEIFSLSLDLYSYFIENKRFNLDFINNPSLTSQVIDISENDSLI